MSTARSTTRPGALERLRVALRVIGLEGRAMTLAPLLDAPPIIRFHAAFAFARRGDARFLWKEPSGGNRRASLRLLVAGVAQADEAEQQHRPCRELGGAERRGIGRIGRV
jgi:hypothetical protein